jgi:uncharacterized protein (TIGR04255 family)
MPNPLPEFENPPLDEVVIGLQFDHLKDFRAAHVGLYWSLIRDRYPLTEDQPPLPPQVEPEELKPPGAIFFQTSSIPRTWFLEQTQNELIQVQTDRFLRNWRQLKGTETYPRFAYLIKRFQEEWAIFLDFLDKESIGKPNVNQCELSYINQLEPGSGWNDYSELSKVFTTLRSPVDGSFLPRPELVTWESRYKLPEGKGRLYVQVQPAFRARDLRLVLQANFTARGNPSQASSDGINRWFEVAHEWIVRGFDQLTEPNMHTFWKKKTC